MNPRTDAKPAGAGFRALVWIAALASMLIVVWLIMMYLVPTPSDHASWWYPKASPPQATNAGPIRYELLSTPDEFDPVSRWYDAKLRIGAGDPAFMGQAIPFGARQLMKISLSKSSARRGTWYCEISSRGLTAALVHRAPEDTTTALTILRLDSSVVGGRKGSQASSALKALTYPAAKSGAGGAAPGLSAFQFSSADSLDRLLAYYLEKFGAASGATLAAGAKLTTGGGAAANELVRLPDSPQAAGQQAALCVLTPTNVFLIHLSRATNAAATEMILGVVDR